MPTTRLALVSGALLQVALTAVETWPVSAVPFVRAVPDDCPGDWFHCTEYGTTGRAPFAIVKAPAVPLPVAVTLYPLVLVLLHTQTLCALDAASAGSTLVKVTSDRPVNWTRFGTVALIATVPVDVAASEP